MKNTIEKSEIHHADWYRLAREAIQAIYGEKSSLFIDILAATSPRVSVRRNWRLATRIIGEYLAGREIDYSGVLPAAIPNVKRALAGQPISGQKVSRFAANLKGDEELVTIDVWICAYYGVDQGKLTAKVYKDLERRIKRAARRAGFTPAGYQAIIWQRARHASGRKSVSFLSAINQQKTFWEI